MGKGKGRRRRRANYIASHGGHAELPTPPSAADMAYLPSKLRRIISLKSSSTPGFGSLDTCKSWSNRLTKDPHQSKRMSNKPHRSHNIEKNEKTLGGGKQDDLLLKAGDGREALQSEASAPKTKKRKREEEFQALFEKYKATPVRRGLNDRKKRYLQEKKRKRKKLSQLDTADGNHSLLKQEKIRFGDVVDAPPKLSFPKKPMSVSDERVRQEAIAMYRQKKSWLSRPGSHQPPPLAMGDAPSS